MTTRAPQGGFQDWAELRNHLIDQYGSTPHPNTEQEIIDAYELHPDAVTKTALDLIGALGITSPWGLLKSKAGKIAHPPSNPTHHTSFDREKQIARAEQWIRAAGIHIDRPDEILEELFDDLGQLRTYAQIDLERTGPPDDNDIPTWRHSTIKGDEALTTRMLDLWAEHRPTGMQIERDAQQRADDWKEQQRLMAESFGRIIAMLDEKQTHLKPLPDADYSAQEPEPVAEATPNDGIPF